MSKPRILRSGGLWLVVAGPGTPAHILHNGQRSEGRMVQVMGRGITVQQAWDNAFPSSAGWREVRRLIDEIFPGAK